jgi:Holliday junction resolvase RusA-like endonuclease
VATFHKYNPKLAEQWNIKRPDGDNLFKAIADAGNGILWEDDSQICDGRFLKLYSKEPSCIVVSIESLT